MTDDIDSIDPKLLWMARGLSAAAYTGFLLLLPSVILQRVMTMVENVGDEIIGQAASIWAGDIADVHDAAAS